MTSYKDLLKNALSGFSKDSATYRDQVKTGIVQTVNADGTYNVLATGQTIPISNMIAPSGDKYGVGDFVTYILNYQDRNQPQIIGRSPDVQTGTSPFSINTLPIGSWVIGRPGNAESGASIPAPTANSLQRQTAQNPVFKNTGTVTIGSETKSIASVYNSKLLTWDIFGHITQWPFGVSSTTPDFNLTVPGGIYTDTTGIYTVYNDDVGNLTVKSLSTKDGSTIWSTTISYPTFGQTPVPAFGQGMLRVGNNFMVYLSVYDSASSPWQANGTLLVLDITKGTIIQNISQPILTNVVWDPDIGFPNITASPVFINQSEFIQWFFYFRPEAEYTDPSFVVGFNFIDKVVGTVSGINESFSSPTGLSGDQTSGTAAFAEQESKGNTSYITAGWDNFNIGVCTPVLTGHTSTGLPIYDLGGCTPNTAAITWGSVLIAEQVVPVYGPSLTSVADPPFFQSMICATQLASATSTSVTSVGSNSIIAFYGDPVSHQIRAFDMQAYNNVWSSVHTFTGLVFQWSNQSYLAAIDVSGSVLVIMSLQDGSTVFTIANVSKSLLMPDGSFIVQRASALNTLDFYS